MDEVRIAEGPSAALRQELDKLARGGRILELNGHGDRIFGHVALRDPDGRGFWLKRHQISLGELFDARDFILVDFDGKQLHGSGVRHSEWPIHAEIFRARPDFNASGHTHPFHAVVFSAAKKALGSISGPGKPPPRFESTSEYIDTPELGRALAASLGQDAKMAIMRHHGVIFAGRTIEEMVLAGIEIEHRAKQMLTVASADLPFEWPDADELTRKFGSTTKRMGGARGLWDYYCRVLARAEAQGDPRLSHRSLL
jgi:ribulose-5-phosphate 4-epimerase/fuculose-1-phosphate aldolase